jgi:hypothetical protein
MSLPAKPLSDFKHYQSAHCESGTASNLLKHHGLDISEPMAFGLGAALSFAYIPLIKLSGLPLIAYRMPPRAVFKGLQKRIGLKMHYRTFRQADKGMDALNAALDKGQAVGLQTSVFWLPYFPDSMRFHFNAHNLIVYGREGNDYLISDPVVEVATRCDAASLKKARFARGALAPKGLLYYPDRLPDAIDYRTAGNKALLANYRIMTGAPFPMIGLRGIRHMGKKINALIHSGANEEQIKLYLTHIVRMQEEVGTGGAGFRFLYASFLQELGKLTDAPLLQEASQQMTEAGDAWRQFALLATRMSRQKIPLDADVLRHTLNQCADQERSAWTTVYQHLSR